MMVVDERIAVIRESSTPLRCYCFAVGPNADPRSCLLALFEMYLYIASLVGVCGITKQQNDTLSKQGLQFGVRLERPQRSKKIRSFSVFEPIKSGFVYFR